MTRAKERDALMVSLLRISDRRSFAAMVRIRRSPTKRGAPDAAPSAASLPVDAVEVSGVIEHFLCTRTAIGELAAIDQCDVGGEFEGFAQLMRGHDYGSSGAARV